MREAQITTVGIDIAKQCSRSMRQMWSADPFCRGAFTGRHY